MLLSHGEGAFYANFVYTQFTGVVDLDYRGGMVMLFIAPFMGYGGDSLSRYISDPNDAAISNYQTYQFPSFLDPPLPNTSGGQFP